ncbi:hypothetical protein [Pseudomonas sp. CFBP13508]|uniref:hypothetical protein n=1 Tax=Pseudomonas sp. CFBP13508 TaxID=2184009 RepID=UPI0010C0BCD7|nr:hypothetical protein [Pseudomonas sp. CFBP13508]
MSKPVMSSGHPTDAQPGLPTIVFPFEGGKTARRPVLFGTGPAGGLIEIWDAGENFHYASGPIGSDERWTVDVFEEIAPGLHQIRARVIAGAASEWSAPRSFRANATDDAPVINLPGESEQVSDVVTFQGTVPRAGGYVDIVDLNDGHHLAQVRVEPDMTWFTQLTGLGARVHRVSVNHRLGGVASNWAGVRTFTVVAEASEGLFDFARLRAFIQNALRKISSIWR